MTLSHTHAQNCNCHAAVVLLYLMLNNVSVSFLRAKTSSFASVESGAALTLNSSTEMAHEIEPRLFLGSIDALDEAWLRTHNITHVISVVPLEPHEHVPVWTIRAQHLEISVRDARDQDLLRYFDQTCAFIVNALAEKPNNNVLVHCYAGISRSASVIIAYLMKLHTWSYPEALACVRQERAIVQPNYAFEVQLRVWGMMQYKLVQYDDADEVLESEPYTHSQLRTVWTPENCISDVASFVHMFEYLTVAD